MTGPTPQVLEELAVALDEYLTLHDADDWCMRIKYGKCSTYQCLRPQGAPPYDIEKATCPRWRLEQALAASSLRSRAAEAHHGKGQGK